MDNRLIRLGRTFSGRKGRLCNMVISRSLSNITIVIVEDHSDTLRFLTRFLNRQGAKVVATDNAFDGLRAIKTHHPNVVLSDITMPKRDGFELLRDVRALERDVGHLPVIAMTGLTSITSPSYLIDVGFEAFLYKPFDPNELLRAIQSVLEN